MLKTNNLREFIEYLNEQVTYKKGRTDSHRKTDVARHNGRKHSDERKIQGRRHSSEELYSRLPVKKDEEK